MLQRVVFRFECHQRRIAAEVYLLEAVFRDVQSTDIKIAVCFQRLQCVVVAVYLFQVCGACQIELSESILGTHQLDEFGVGENQCLQVGIPVAGQAFQALIAAEVQVLQGTRLI